MIHVSNDLARALLGDGLHSRWPLEKMDHPLDENVVEPDKYAFLLGCSLRENNLEQFFSVYDAILPKHLSESQLDKIKERARQISELPQDEFDELVLRARDYSLAQGRGRTRTLDMSGLDRSGSTRGPGVDDWNSGSEDEEDGTVRRCPAWGDNFTLLSRGSRYGEDKDSGLPSSGKGAGSWCENDVSDSEDRGVIHYFPSYESTKKTDAVKISETDNPDFDEIHDVESDKSSIESPRSDASSTNEYNVTNPDDGFEMKTINREEIPRFKGINIHRQLYNRPYRSEIPYSQLRNDCDNDDEVSYGNSYQQRQHLGYGRSVDDTVCFPIHNKHYQFSKSLEEAESGGFQKHDSFYDSPFGNKDPLKYVGESINNLIGSGSSVVSNMPPGADIHDEARKKKNMKKKKGSKDDGDDRVSNSKTRKSFMSHDENGNPIDLSAYRQMRDIPNKTEGSARKQPNYGTYNHHGPFASDTTNFDANIQLQGQGKDLEDGPSNTDRKKNRKKTHKEPVKLAEDIPNYVGDIDSVDDLVKFIETGEKQVKKKVSQKTSPNSEPPAKADKVIKRKEKKVKVGQTDETGVPVSECGERLLSPTPSAGEAGVTSPVPVPASPPVVSPTLVADSIECLEEDMGNSGDKSAAVTSEADSQSIPESEDKQSLLSESPVVLNKDCDPPSGRISSSKSPPLHKKEIDHKDRNKSRAKEKEKEKSLEAAISAESKKQKGKNGKTDLQVKNNKKVETRNDIINNTKSVEKMKIESNGPITVVSHVERDDLGIVDNHQDYIFTDIDNLPPVEQEFTLVSKKKKRQGAKDIVAEIPRQKNGPREYRGLPAPRSVTPPPPSLLKKEQSRDLSPSSFPALGKKASVSKARPTFREGRRNSFGDVPIDTLTELRSQDDSDIESVKSLPAAKGGSLGDVVSSRFPVSYAKMAAAPKPPNSPTSPKAEEEEDEEREEDMSGAQSDSASSRKPTVWKGSPTERRHSIGSSPEDTKQENSPKFTQRSRQKSGSQEFLLNVECVKTDVDVSVPDSVEMQSSSVSVNEVNIVSSSCSSEITVSEDPELTPIPVSKELSPETQFSPSTDSQPIPTITVTLDSNKLANVVKNNNPNGPKVVGPQGAKSPDVNSTSAVPRSLPPASSSSSSKESSRGKTMTGKVANSSRKNNKSVIFLDKRFGDEPENLGITFGFDSNFEHDDGGMCKVGPIDATVNEIPQEAASCNRKEPNIHNQMEAQSVPVTIPPERLPKAEPTSVAPPASTTATATGSGSTTGGSPATSTAGVVVRGGASTVALPGSMPPPPATSSTSNKPSSKTRVGGLNGVVVPKTQGYRNRPASEALRTERVAVSSSESKGATAAASSASGAASASSKKDNNKTVLVFYGDGIKAKIGNSDVTIDSRDRDPPSSSQHKGQLSFSQDANHKGKFNVNEAARFLKQEWERVLEQQEKNPKAVVFYNGQ